MAQPAEYNRRKDFTDQDGDETDHNALNQEFDAAAQSINEIRDNLALIQKDDGSLANQSVGADQLQPGVFDAYQADLDAAVARASTAADESTRSAVASGEFAAVSQSASERAVQAESNAEASAANAAGAAKAMFDGIYLGSRDSDPLVDGNGQPLTDGDFYFNNVAKLIRTWDAASSKWVNATPSGQFKRQAFEAGADFTPGTTTSLTLASDPQTVSNIFVHFDAAFQQPTEYSLSGQTLTFTSPIPVGVQSVAVAYLEAVFVPITNALLVFQDYAAASAAAATLPDGQDVLVKSEQTYYGVQSGALVSRTVAQIVSAATISGVAWTLNKSTTVRIPSEAPSLQAALNAIQPANPRVVITLIIESGHSLASGVTAVDQDYSQFIISSEDAVVPLSAGFSGSIFVGNGISKMPVLNCLIDAANQVSGNGFSLQNGAEAKINPSCGIKNCYGTALQASYGCHVVANSANFSYAARNGTTGAGITAWASVISAEYADVSFSGYYGAQAAHGGMLSFKQGKANDCYRYGIRATDGALIDAEGCDASRAGVIGIYAFNGGIISARPCTAKNCGSQNVAATNGSIINVMEADLTGAGTYGIYAAGASTINATDSNASGGGTGGVFSASSSNICAFGVNARKGAADSSVDFVVSSGGAISLNASSVGGLRQEPNIVTPSGVIYGTKDYAIKEIVVNSIRNDWDIGVGVASSVNAASTGGDRAVNGISGGYPGAQITVRNTSLTQNFTFSNDSANSLAHNRFTLPGAATLTLPAGGSVTFKYVNSRWILQAKGF